MFCLINPISVLGNFLPKHAKLRDSNCSFVKNLKYIQYWFLRKDLINSTKYVVSFYYINLSPDKILPKRMLVYCCGHRKEVEILPKIVAETARKL